MPTYSITKAWPVLFLFLLILLVIQGGIFMPLRISVNLVFLFGVMLAAATTLPEVLVFSILAGVLTDFISGLPDGVFTLSFLIIFGLLFFVINVFLPKREKLWPLAIVAVLATPSLLLLVPVVIWLLSLFKITSPVGLFSFFTSGIWLEIVGSLLMFLPIYYFFVFYEKAAHKFAIMLNK